MACPVLLLIPLAALSAGPQQPQHAHEHEVGERLGTVRFPVSCGPAARRDFERAVALLHSFQYEESERAFAAVAQAEPSCAMAYWGIAMSLYHPVWAAANPSAAPAPEELARGRSAVERAKAAGTPRAREREYIAAIEAFYRDSERLDHRARALAYVRAMEQVARRHPKDPEAAIFYAVALLGTPRPTDKTYATQRQAAEILNRVLPGTRDHPGVAHYLIHSFDYPELARLALPAARAYANIAPASPHALHMPSHIFTRLAMWQESIRSNLASAAAARRLMARTHPGATHYDELHAMDYLVYAYLQGVEDRKAEGVVAEMRVVRLIDQATFAAAYAFAATPARFVLERRRWSDAAALGVWPADFPWQKFPYAEAIVHFARVLGAARSGDSTAARKSLDRLEQIRAGLSEAGDRYWADQVEVERRAAAAWVARSEGKDREAVDLLRSSAELDDSMDKHPVTPGAVLPARELLGDLFLDLGRAAEALKEYESTLARSPGRFNSLAGAARAAERAGDLGKARGYYAQLVAQCGSADAAHPDLDRAKALLR